MVGNQSIHEIVSSDLPFIQHALQQIEQRPLGPLMKLPDIHVSVWLALQMRNDKRMQLNISRSP